MSTLNIILICIACSIYDFILFFVIALVELKSKNRNVYLHDVIEELDREWSALLLFSLIPVFSAIIALLGTLLTVIMGLCHLLKHSVYNKIKDIKL